MLLQDIKGDNVLMWDGGRYKISDFGLAVSTKPYKAWECMFSERVGTKGWMAPEVMNITDDGYNSQADIWSFGCLMIEVWTGKRPKANVGQVDQVEENGQVGAKEDFRSRIFCL